MDPTLTIALTQPYYSQEDLANEYTDGDALGLNPNPLTGEASLKHKFTLPNPYGDDQTPYETGMELYRSGDYSNAILAFEVPTSPDPNPSTS